MTKIVATFLYIRFNLTFAQEADGENNKRNCHETIWKWGRCKPMRTAACYFLLKTSHTHTHARMHAHSHTHTLINLKNVISLLRKWQFIGGFYYSQFISTPQGNALRMLRPAPCAPPTCHTLRHVAAVVAAAVTVGSLLRPAKVDAANKQNSERVRERARAGQADRQRDKQTCTTV